MRRRSRRPTRRARATSPRRSRARSKRRSRSWSRTGRRTSRIRRARRRRRPGTPSSTRPNCSLVQPSSLSSELLDQREDLPIDVVHRRGEEDQRADHPAVAAHRRRGGFRHARRRRARLPVLVRRHAFVLRDPGARPRLPVILDGGTSRGRRGTRVRRGRRSADGLLGLVLTRLGEVVGHRLARGRGIVRANRAVDPPVRFGGVAQVAVGRAFRRHAPLLVVERRRPSRRATATIGFPDAAATAAVEIDVVHEKALRIVERREEAGRRHRRASRADRAWRVRPRAPAAPTSRMPARFVHLLAREAVERRLER